MVLKILLRLLAAAMAIQALSVWAGERRVALVIGNAAYPGAPLGNPVNDARDMAEALRKLGFEVIEKTNVGQKEMNRAIVQFGERLRADTTALFYYAGHGIQIRGKNYLVPIDAQIATEAAARAETVDVDNVTDQLAVSALNIVILDACRNNPFERRFRGAGGGLAQMEAPKGSLIAFSTAPGKVASDGSGRNGLYTQELLKHIQTPGLPLEAVFKRVRNGVMAKSGEAQTPWESSSLTGDFFFSGQAAGGEPAATTPPPVTAPSARTPEQIEDELWDVIKNETTPGVFEEYLKHYPNGRYLAQAQIKLLSRKVERARDEIGEIYGQTAKKQDDRTVVVVYHTKSDVEAAQTAVVRTMRTIDSGALFNPYWIVGMPRRATNPATGCGIVVGTWYQSGFPVRAKWERIMESLGNVTTAYALGYSTGNRHGFDFDDMEKMRALMQKCSGYAIGGE